MASALYGHTLRSDIALSRARPGTGERRTLTVVASTAPLDPQAGRTVGEDTDGQVRLGRTEDGGLRVWCPRIGTWALDAGALRIVADRPHGDQGWWEHRFACLVVPLLLAERGDLALHASAVRVGHGAVLFCGTREAGKSTVAWALGEQGHGVLAEDGTALSVGDAGAIVWPGLTGVRLRDAGGAHGAPTATTDTGAAGVPLTALVLLDPRGGSAPRVTPVDPLATVRALMPQALHVPGSSSQALAFAAAARLARGVPVLRGRLPDDLPGVHAHAAGMLDAVLAGL